MPRPVLWTCCAVMRPLSRRAIGPGVRRSSHNPSYSPSVLLRPTAATSLQCRPLTTTSILSKKAGKANKSQARTDSPPPVDPKDAGGSTATDEAFDFGTLESSILKAIERLTHNLSQLRAGGRFNPEVLEKLKVMIKSEGGERGEGGPKHAVRLSELAQVVPKGRIMQVIAGDESHIKPLMTAISASQQNLTPTHPSPDSPLTITVPTPPPTGESKQQALDEARKFGETADKAIHDARAAHQKKLRNFQKDRSVRPDDLQKAHKMMEDVVKKGNGEVKTIVDGARRVLDS